MKTIAGISEVIIDFEAFIVDIWGVLHNGFTPYPGVIDCLQKIRSKGREVMLLSNSARRRDLAQRDLEKFGIAPDLYDHLVTSGEFTNHCLSTLNSPELSGLGKTYFLIGSEKYGLTDGLDYLGTDSVNKADFLLVIGVEVNPSTTKRYQHTHTHTHTHTHN